VDGNVHQTFVQPLVQLGLILPESRALRKTIRQFGFSFPIPSVIQLSIHPNGFVSCRNSIFRLPLVSIIRVLHLGARPSHTSSIHSHSSFYTYAYLQLGIKCQALLQAGMFLLISSSVIRWTIQIAVFYSKTEPISNRLRSFLPGAEPKVKDQFCRPRPESGIKGSTVQ